MCYRIDFFELILPKIGHRGGPEEKTPKNNTNNTKKAYIHFLCLYIWYQSTWVSSPPLLSMNKIIALRSLDFMNMIYTLLQYLFGIYWFHASRTKALGFYFSRVTHLNTNLHIPENKSCFIFSQRPEKKPSQIFFFRERFFSTNRLWGPTSKNRFVFFSPFEAETKNWTYLPTYLPISQKKAWKQCATLEKKKTSAFV